MSTPIKAAGFFAIGYAAASLFILLVLKPIQKVEIAPERSNADSLQYVVDSLQNEITLLENQFDSKESRYEDTIFEYELGISYLKDYHPNAYKDFHRLIGMRERYSTELEKENSKRLKQYK